MRTLELKAYTFHELDDKTKQIVLDRYRDVQTEDDWYGHIIDGWKEKLAAIGFLNADISFSGFGSQGDGCSFKAELDLDVFLVNEFDPLLKEDTEFFFDEYRGYSHYHHWTIKQDSYLSCDAMDKLCNEFVEWINEYKQDLEGEIYNDLMENFDYLISDEAVIEFIDANELEFFEDGRDV